MGTNEQDKLINNLIDKSIEAFIMGIEIYNKPTIRYRVEGFSFFVCNAWELMLKAEMLKRNMDIYFANDRSRTLSLAAVVKAIYSDKSTYTRRNLEKIIELRNVSTHFINEDYEAKYIPLFQACVLNFINEIKRFHRVDICDYIASNFLTLSTRYEPLTNEEIRLKYPAEIAERMIQQVNDIDVLAKEYDSENFAINIKQKLYITKNKGEADFSVRIDKDSETPVEIVKELKDPSDTHKYSYTNAIEAIKKRLQKRHIELSYEKGFNSHLMTLIIDFYNVKSNDRFAYCHLIGRNKQYTYSQEFIDFVVGEIQKEPDAFINSLLKHKKR